MASLMNTASAVPPLRPALRPAFRAALAAVPVAIVAGFASAATLPNIPGWYEGLAKPPGTPPNFVFGPAWTVLYVIMAFAFWRVLSSPPGTPFRRAAISAFLAQLALNGLWSVCFFGLRNPALGLVEIAILLAAIAATLALFRRLDGPAALALVPYAAWVVFAAYLNFGVWRLNP